MKARTENGKIITYQNLPNEYTKSDGSVILNFQNASTEVWEEEGFFDVIKPNYNSQTQYRGGLAWDAENNVFTFPINDIDFDEDVDVIGEDGEPTGETEKRYKIADIKLQKLSEIKYKAGQLLQPTDWQVIRKIERDVDIDADIATERAGILTEADRLEAEVNSKTDYADVLQYNVQFFPSSDPGII